MHRMSVPLLAVVLAAATIVPSAAAARAVDVRASHASFTVRHALIQNVIGSIEIVGANVDLAADGVTPQVVAATLDPRRIDSGDPDRDGDLQGPDWFDTKRFPIWTFASTSVTTKTPGVFAIAGMLSVHGTSVPVTLETTLVRRSPAPIYRAVAHVDRHAFGMAVTRIDPLVGSDVEIDLDIHLQ